MKSKLNYLSLSSQKPSGQKSERVILTKTKKVKNPSSLTIKNQFQYGKAHSSINLQVKKYPKTFS